MSRAFPPKVVGAGEGKTVMLFGVRFGYKVVNGDSGGRLAILEVEIPARTLVKPHAHAREDEFSLVLSGTVGVRTGDRVHEAGPGPGRAPPRRGGAGKDLRGQALSFDRVAGQAVLEECEGLGGELADVGREAAEVCAV